LKVTLLMNVKIVHLLFEKFFDFVQDHVGPFDLVDDFSI